MRACPGPKPAELRGVAGALGEAVEQRARMTLQVAEGEGGDQTGNAGPGATP